MKKLLKILLLLFLLSLAALALYNFVILPYQKEKNQTNTGEISKEGEEEKKRVFQISAEPVIGPAISQDKNHIVYYIKSTGQVKQVDLDGRNTKTISSVQINNLTDIKWSLDKDQVFCARIKDNIPDLYIYNYSKKQVFPLNGNMRGIEFSKNGQKIAYNYTNNLTGENNISISDPDGTNYGAILNTRINNSNLKWIDSLRLAIWEYSSYENSASALIVDTGSLHLERILSEKNGLSIVFSPNGNTALYSYTDSNGKNLKLGFYNMQNKKETEAEASSIAEKCVWSQNNEAAYCAIGQKFPLSGMPDKYYDSKDPSKDYFVKIDSKTGKYTEVFPKITSFNIDAAELFLSPTEDRLYFIDKSDEKLYGLQL